MNTTTLRTHVHRILAWLWYWLPPVLVMAGIFYLSHQPDLPHAPEPWLDVLLKKLGHAAEYAVLFLLLVRALCRNLNTHSALQTSWLVAAAYAVSDEIHQAFVPGRKANWYDVAIDVSAALCLWWLLRSSRWRRSAGYYDFPE